MLPETSVIIRELIEIVGRRLCETNGGCNVCELLFVFRHLTVNSLLEPSFSSCLKVREADPKNCTESAQFPGRQVTQAFVLISFWAIGVIITSKYSSKLTMELLVSSTGSQSKNLTQNFAI